MTPTKPKVMVAMSGGVDSSVAAAMLVRAGYEVVGCFMRLGSPGEALEHVAPDPGACAREPGTAKIGSRGCCSINDAADARLVAAELGIPFYVCNFKKDFGRIIDYFVDEYAAGRTPNPCVRCNDWLKFGTLYDQAASIGAKFVATGHYARVLPAPDAGCAASADMNGSRRDLHRGLDRAKDQSYVLFGIARARLARTLLPIGGMRKPDVRELAQRFGLPVFDKPDSQDICFIPDNDYASFVERRRPDLTRPGTIVHTDGRVLGQHTGQHRFTVGQRRGVPVALGLPVYVVERRADSNEVTVGPRAALRVRGCVAREANWLNEELEPSAPAGEVWLPCLAQFRAHGEAVPARFRLRADAVPAPSERTGAFDVEFDAPQEAVAPGQAIVLYDAREPERVLGGGWIATTVS